MKVNTKNILGMIFLVASLGSFEPSMGFYLGRRHVNIVNRLENHEPLMVHCWQDDGDLGQYNLKYEEEFRREFMDVFPFQHVKIECNMEFKDVGGNARRGHFVVYDTSKYVRRRECYKWCNWSVGIYGLYAYDEVDKRWDYEIPWPSKNSF